VECAEILVERRMDLALHEKTCELLVEMQIKTDLAV